MIILFGVVGSGKSEQAKLLVAKLNCPHISTSRLLKDNSNQEWDKLMMAGKLVPDEDIYSVLGPELEKIKDREFILDGAPRSVAQAEWLSNKIKAGDLNLTAIIHLKASKDVVMKRLLARGREDDNEAVIANRLSEYEQVTTPVLDYLKEQGYKISEVDGDKSLEEVEQQIWQVLGDKVAPQVR